MTVWLVVIAVVLVLILGALERGNSLKAAQIEAEREHHDTERLDAEEQREHDRFFTANNYPHRNDAIRIAAWAAERGWDSEQAREFLLDSEMHDDISRSLDASRKQRLLDIQRHGWQVAYVALAFTPEQRAGREFRPIHGMIWKPGEEKYFLNLVDMSEFAKGGCDAGYPLGERSIPQATFTIEKEQKYDWDEAENKLC